MAPVYADHPYPLISTPVFLVKSRNEEPDMFDYLASDMALVHNLIIRGLNSIYLQAPHIKPADEMSFCRYITGWYNLLHSHHSGEEAMFFPNIEKMTGVKGVMDTEIDQHKAFHDGLDVLKAYVDAVLTRKEKYEGSRVVTLLDDVGGILAEHLTGEINSILRLRQYGDKMAGLQKVFDEEADKAIKELGPQGMVFCFANLDVHYENAMWPNFPPAPTPARVLLWTVLWWVYSDARKFGAADRSGKLRHLYAVPKTP